jgi:hypothetical protein
LGALIRHGIKARPTGWEGDHPSMLRIAKLRKVMFGVPDIQISREASRSQMRMCDKLQVPAAASM